MKTKQLLLTAALGLLAQAWGAGYASADTGTNDAQLRLKAQEKLAHAKLADKVDLKVEDAAATLSGTVDSIWQKERASREIAKVPGILTVANELKVADPIGGDDKLLGRIVHEIRLYPQKLISCLL